MPQKRSRFPGPLKTVRPGRDEPGFTIVEAVVVSGLLIVFMVTLATVFSAMSRGIADSETQLLAATQQERGLQTLFDDLQSADTAGRDSAGVPYFQIVDDGGGTRNAIVFRKVVGFTVDPDQDLVTATYSTPIRYFVNDEGALVRSQDNAEEVVATRARGIQFALGPDGAVEIELATSAGHGESTREIKGRLRIRPRNTLDL